MKNMNKGRFISNPFHNQKLNLQIFAEPSGTDTSGADSNDDTSGNVDTGTDNTPDIQKLMTELAEARALAQRNKNALDKTMKELGDTKKSLREKMTAEEAELAAQAEAERIRNEEVEAMRKELASIKATSRYQTKLSMGEDLAKEAVECELNGDFEGLVDVLVKHIKSVETNAVQGFLKSRPDIKYGGNAEGAKPGMEQAKRLAERKAVTQKSKDILGKYVR